MGIPKVPKVLHFTTETDMSPNLPQEMLLCIFCELDAPSLAVAHRVCRLWNDLAEHPVVWKSLVHRHFGVPTSLKKREKELIKRRKEIQENLAKNIDWKSVYREVFELQKPAFAIY